MKKTTSWIIYKSTCMPDAKHPANRNLSPAPSHSRLMYFTADVQPVPALLPAPSPSEYSSPPSEYNFRTDIDDCSTASCIMRMYTSTASPPSSHHQIILRRYALQHAQVLHASAALPPAGAVIYRPPVRVGWGNRVTQLLETALFAVASRRSFSAPSN